jgi:hypothetical protein
MRQATQDEIITEIHVLWERGWKVSPESVQEMLRKGPRDSSLEQIEKIIREYASPKEKERWLSSFKSAKNAFWQIDNNYQYQYQEYENHE